MPKDNVQKAQKLLLQSVRQKLSKWLLHIRNKVSFHLKKRLLKINKYVIFKYDLTFFRS